MSDNVKHPSHYAEGRQFEPKDVIRDWGLNFNLGNAVKYLARAGRKVDTIEDLKKAQQYIQFEIEAIEAEQKQATKPKAHSHSVSNSPTPHKGCSSCMERKECADAYTERSPHCGNYGGRKIGIVGVPTGIPTEMIIKRIIEDIYGVR